jgi:two-component system alkaline phosphatase synthesis response regulator PhoP
VSVLNKERILLVEDDPSLVLALSDRLESDGYRIDCVKDGETGVQEAIKGTYDLILLDVMLPGKSGFEVCRELRRRGVETRILMLTARAQLSDKVEGLDLGADDYLTKPFEVAELLARIKALLRRSFPTKRLENIRFGDVEIDFVSAEVARDGIPVKLSALEFQLLRHLIENEGILLSRNELLDAVWGVDAMPSTRTVDVHISWLRQKLELEPHNPRFILTVRGLGYKFVA